MVKNKDFNSWNDYLPLIELMKEKRIESNLFPGREEAKQLFKKYTKELFEKYPRLRETNFEFNVISFI